MAPLSVHLVASDPQRSRHLAATLEANGCAVDRHALHDDDAARPPADPEAVVLLHVESGDPGSLAWCRDLRRDQPHARLCVLFETALVGEVAGALQLGADAALCRPVAESVLLAQLAALARRPTASRFDRGDVRPRPLPDADLEVDLPGRLATLDGRILLLTDAEFDLLALLARHPGVVLTRDAISRELRGHPHRDHDRAFDLRVVQLRRKLGDDARRPRLLKSVRGLGYLLAVRPRVRYEIDT